MARGERSFAVQHRQNFIRAHLLEKGSIRRADLCEKFKISEPQASNDFKLMLIEDPDFMRYDRGRKAYMLLNGTPTAPPTLADPKGAETFYCEVGLMSGAFNSRISLQLDSDAAAIQKFIESWLALMASAIKLGSA